MTETYLAERQEVLHAVHRIVAAGLVSGASGNVSRRISTPEGLIRQFDRITYTADGMAMSMEREIKTTQGGFKMKLVFDKQ